MTRRPVHTATLSSFLGLDLPGQEASSRVCLNEYRIHKYICARGNNVGVILISGKVRFC